MSQVLRFIDLVPEIYPNQSRDFQLLCRLLDLAFNGCLQTADKLKFANYPEYCSDDQLKLLSHKLGFQYTAVIHDDELRKILKCFKRLVSYKGSYKGIKESIQLFMNIKHKYFSYSIDIETQSSEANAVPSIIYITVYDEIIDDLSILTDILKYILPCGYSFKYRFVTSIPVQENKFGTESNVDGVLINTVNNSLHQIISPENGIVQNVSDATQSLDIGDSTELLNGFNTMQVVSQEQISKSLGKAVLIDVWTDQDEE